MVSLNSSMYVGLKGINAARAGLNVTGNNISNVNTEGYSRQSVELTARRDSRLGGLMLGTGVDIKAVTAARNNLIEQTFTQQTNQLGFHQEMYQLMKQMESIVEDSDYSGIDYSFQRFFSGMEEAASRPDQLAPRQELLESGGSLALEIRNRYNQLEEMQGQVNQEVKAVIDQINLLTEQIAELNVQISTSADEPNNLIDERQRMVNELSELAGIDVFEMHNNLIQVNLKNTGYILVGNTESTPLTAELNTANNNYWTVSYPFNGVQTDIGSELTLGKIEAKMQIRDSEIPALKRRLDNLAAGLIQSVNAIHQTGFAMDGTTTNLNFFTPFVSGAAGPDNNLGAAAAISISTDVLDQPENVALSATGAIGDNEIGNQLAALRQNTTVIDSDGDGALDSGTFEAYLHETMAGLGSAINSASDSRDTQEALLIQTKGRRSEISEVSLDEEAVKLTQYQRAFQASSKFISLIDQLTGDIINQLR
ncbi:MAG: flagellar hook-associated protein FlgK [Acidobacteria bacterium]|nr:MAG: flagellar hook-associated protein FlgK [Acidobacteriota bacterium]